MSDVDEVIAASVDPADAPLADPSAIAVDAAAPSSKPAVYSPDLLIIDINGLGYASLFTGLGKLEHNGFPTGAIHGAIISVFTRMAQRPGAMPVILWDSKAEWRHEMLPEYKGTRGGDPGSERERIRASYREQVPFIQYFLNLLGVPQINCGGAEADDVAGVLTRELDKSWKIEMTSRDGDWWQGLDERSVWYSPVHGKGLDLAGLSNPENGMKDGYFLSVDEFLEAKALSGDTSDEIPGIEKVGMATAVKIIRKYGSSIKDFWAKVDDGSVKPKGVVEERVANAESRAIFERNSKLMDWRLAPPLDLSLMSFTCGEANFEQFEFEALELNLKKLVSSARTALKPWKDGWGPGINAVDAALYSYICQPVVNPRAALLAEKAPEASDASPEISPEAEQAVVTPEVADVPSMSTPQAIKAQTLPDAATQEPRIEDVAEQPAPIAPAKSADCRVLDVRAVATSDLNQRDQPVQPAKQITEPIDPDSGSVSAASLEADAVLLASALEAKRIVEAQGKPPSDLSPQGTLF